MNTHDHQSNEQDEPTEVRYGAFETEDGRIIFDTENGRAWIESDTTMNNYTTER